MEARVAKLIVHTTVDGEIWQAGSVPPPDVAARITNPACWDEPPAGTPLTAVELAEVARHETAVVALGHESGDPPQEPTPDPVDGETGPDVLTEAEVVGSQHLDDVPLEHEALLAFADAHGLDVNRKLGPVNLKAAIAKALEAG